jgi:hypothetical protein
LRNPGVGLVVDGGMDAGSGNEVLPESRRQTERSTEEHGTTEKSVFRRVDATIDDATKVVQLEGKLKKARQFMTAAREKMLNQQTQIQEKEVSCLP